MADGTHGIGAALARRGQGMATDALEHTTGLKIKGFFSGIFQSIKAKICGPAKPKVTIAEYQASQGGGRDYQIRLRSGKSPALALDSLRQQVRQPAQPPAARAGQPLAPAELARGESQVRRSVIEESVAEQTSRYLTGVKVLENEVSRMAQSTVPSDQQTSLRHQLLSEIPKEFAQIRELLQAPGSGITRDEALKAQELLALSAMRVLAPKASITSVSQEFVAGLVRLSEKGMLTEQMLSAIESRAEFWADQVQGTSELVFLDDGISPAEKVAQAKAFYIENYINDLIAVERQSTMAPDELVESLKKKVGHTKAYRDAETEYRKDSPALINDLRLKSHENTVNELLQFSDRNEALALDLKLLSATNDQEKKLVTMRHELSQIKKYLFEIAAIQGSGIDKASFQNIAMDTMLLTAWKSRSDAKKDVNILIGQALALQSEIVELELQQMGHAISGRRHMVDLQDLKLLGLTEKSLGELQKNEASVQEILETARSYAGKGFSSTTDLQKFRDHSKAAFKGVLNGWLANRANADIRSLLPAERAQVLGVLLERNRPAELRVLMERPHTAQALSDLKLQGSESGQAGISQTSGDRYRSLEKHLGREVDRMLKALDQGLSARDRLADLEKGARIKLDPQDKATRELAVNLRDYLDLSTNLEQMRSLESKLATEISSVKGGLVQAQSSAVSVLQQDFLTIQGQIKDVMTRLTLVSKQIAAAKGPLADRLWKNPDTESLNVTGKLSFDPVLFQAVDALTQYADGEAEGLRSEASIKTLTAGMDECLEQRRITMGTVTSEALSNALRAVTASTFSTFILERELNGDDVSGAMLLPLHHKDQILAELAQQGINEEVYGPEIRNILHREIGITDIEGWLKEAKAVDKQRRAEIPAFRRDSDALPAEAEQVLKTILNLKDDERFFLGSGYDIEATTGGVKVVGVGVSLTLGGGKDLLFEVRREGDEAVLRVADSTKLKAALGAKAKFGDLAVAKASVGGALTRGDGFVARYKSTQDLAVALRQLYVSKGVDSSMLMASASSVSQLTDSEKRINAGISATASLIHIGEALAEIGNEPSQHPAGAKDKKKSDESPWGIHIGASVTAAASVTWRDTTVSNNQVQTVKHARSYDLQIAASAGIALTAPTVMSTVSEKLDLKNKTVIGEQFAGKASSMQEEGGIEIFEKSIGIKNERVVSELSITQSLRDRHLQAVSCNFKFGAPKGMTLERLGLIAPGYVDQIRQQGAEARARCDVLFEQIGGSGFELVLTARLKPEIRDQWNRDYEAAQQALARERPTKSSEIFEKESKAVEKQFARRLDQLTRNDDNMQVTGLSLHKVESSDRGIALDAVLIKGNMSARAGLGEMVNQVSFVPQRSSNSAAKGGNSDLDRLLAESQSRQQELLSRLAGAGRM